MSTTTSQADTLAELTNLAKEVSTACPDMRQMAREVALKLLQAHGLDTLEPDRVYFHRFHGAASSPRTFNGWQHHQAPYQSQTLPQLVMARFTSEEQEASDLLDQFTGFYRTGPAGTTFDETNEIRLSPKAVMDVFWQIDLSSDFQTRMSIFWANHAGDYRLLAKATFMSKVLEACAQSPASTLAQRSREAALCLTGTAQWPPSMANLREEVIPAGPARLCTFDIGGHLASDILRLVRDDGSQLLYLPGEEPALRQFSDDRELFAWVLAQTRDERDRARFFNHFPLASHVQDGDQAGLLQLLEIMRRQWAASRPVGLNMARISLRQDAFTWLRDTAQKRMAADASFALRSNADLRKQLWVGYLQTFNRVFGPMAPGAWQIALAATGAGLAETALDIDLAVHAPTTAKRQSAVIAAIIASLNTLFNAAVLYSAGVNAEGNMKPEPFEAQPVEEQELEPATAAQIATWVPDGYTAADTDELLETLESNDILTSAPGDSQFQGVITEQGRHYAMVGDLTYQVRFINEFNTWAIIDPENPFSPTSTLPLRRDADGAWLIAARPGLYGGTPRFLLKAWGRLRPRPALPALEPTPYEVAPEHQDSLRRAAFGQENQALVESDSAPYRLYRTLRDALEADARTFYRSLQPLPRPVLPELASTASGKSLVRALYAERNGLVIGESHVERGARQFLITHMGQLKKQGVRVIYLEHFMTDFQQAELDVFNQTGSLTPALKSYVDTFDAYSAMLESTPYTMKKVLYAAHAQEVRVQGIDCLASYRQAWYVQPSLTTRQQMMNYYAQRIIALDQSARGSSKWVALVGNSHVNSFMSVPGIADLEGVIGMRVKDIEIGQPSIIGADPGFADDVLGEPVFVKSDLLLQAPLARPWM
ncbi:hypothetical protein CXQ80_04855 [Pseudomonas sp. 02C 26]|uniref:membrane-targeted effector domain-containing toxin n=1 Tax=Pseudomonas sp. 02C 26 TaxID=2054914 RepID=UPI000C6DA9E1|nr:membrane-targeted effector domain-containing toxin [Pseudomonas sp. 02C 26]AUF95195.1 hypothetical protein CXQ80_04855 [Pseudomonas sp. 02C 26]